MLCPQDNIKKMDFFSLSSFCTMIEKDSAVGSPTVNLWSDLPFWNGVKQKASSPSGLKKSISNQLKWILIFLWGEREPHSVKAGSRVMGLRTLRQGSR